MAERIRHDGVIVVGAGLAGLTAAMAAAPAKVLLLTEAPLNHGCSSAWAQGGMAAALSEGDILRSQSGISPCRAADSSAWVASLNQSGIAV